MSAAVTVTNLGKRFRRFHNDRPQTVHEALIRGFRKLLPADRFWGLRSISFTIERGKMVAIIGRNGAGKSTLLRLIGGSGRPDEGSVDLQGKVSALLTLGAGFHVELTGRENLRINAVLNGMTRKEAAAREGSIIEFAELEDFIDSPLRAFSTGMAMRLAFSIAIHAEPEVLLIDEVLSVGDIAFQRKCMERIYALKKRGCTIIVVSHDTSMAETICDETLWLRAGQLEAHGPSRLVVPRYLAASEQPTWNHPQDLETPIASR